LAPAEIIAHQRPAVHVGETVDTWLKRFGMGRQAALERLRDAWSEVVGPDLARYCAPVALHGTRLDVEADSSSWLYELRTVHADEILARVGRASEGLIKAVRFVPRGRRYGGARRRKELP
jgi:predicted nucleic acid-binding Zn ribbon protein